MRHAPVVATLLVLAVIALPVPTNGQQKSEPPKDKQETIARALSAAPEDVARNAAVVEHGPDGEIKELRAGTNGWVCMAEPEAMCLDKQWQNWAAAWMSKKDPQVTGAGVAYMLAGEVIGASNTDPYAKAPTADNQWVLSPAHIMILVPDTQQLEGLPTDPATGGPWVMWKGTKYAHIMVPTAPMPEQKKSTTSR